MGRNRAVRPWRRRDEQRFPRTGRRRHRERAMESKEKAPMRPASRPGTASLGQTPGRRVNPNAAEGFGLLPLHFARGAREGEPRPGTNPAGLRGEAHRRRSSHRAGGPIPVRPAKAEKSNFFLLSARYRALLNVRGPCYPTITHTDPCVIRLSVGSPWEGRAAVLGSGRDGFDVLADSPLVSRVHDDPINEVAWPRWPISVERMCRTSM